MPHTPHPPHPQVLTALGINYVMHDDIGAVSGK